MGGVVGSTPARADDRASGTSWNPRRSRCLFQPPIFEMPVSDADQDKLRSRLSRIEGQIRGLQRMVEEDRYCGDILDQIHSVQKALTSVGRVITRNHLETCVTDALRSGDEEAAKETYDEIMGLLKKEL